MLVFGSGEMIVANTRSRCYCGTRWRREKQNGQRYMCRSSSGGCCGGGGFGGGGSAMKMVPSGMDLGSTRKLEVRARSEDFRKINNSRCCSCQPTISSLEMFLKSTMPTVPVQYLSKTSMRALGTCNGEGKPYFALEGLWEFFKEWSAYGAGVPLVLNESGSVVQYYVPYLSGIQLYVESTVASVITRGPGVDSDGEYSRDSSSDVSSDCEVERSLKSSTNWKRHYNANDSEHRLADLSLREKHNEILEGFSSDDSITSNSQACPLFEFFEQDPPYSRVPLADKISQLACRFPRLMTLMSCELSPSSWMSVAWYPIYRIPTGTTLRDLDACFLTYHSLATPLGDGSTVHSPTIVQSQGTGHVSEISLPVFGLASYKMKGSVWTPNGGNERQHVQSLLQAADRWLHLRHADHPDYKFFTSRSSTVRR